MQAVYFETTAAGGISWEEVQESQLKGDTDGSADKKQARKKLSISIPKWCGKWVVSMDEYKDGVVGAKSKNLAGEYLQGLHILVWQCGRYLEESRHASFAASAWTHLEERGGWVRFEAHNLQHDLKSLPSTPHPDVCRHAWEAPGRCEAASICHSTLQLL
jgi:hypothetical protein